MVDEGGIARTGHIVLACLENDGRGRDLIEPWLNPPNQPVDLRESAQWKDGIALGGGGERRNRIPGFRPFTGPPFCKALPKNHPRTIRLTDARLKTFIFDSKRRSVDVKEKPLERRRNELHRQWQNGMGPGRI